MAGAKDGVTFLEEFRDAGFNEVVLLRTGRNGRTKNPKIVMADVMAKK